MNRDDPSNTKEHDDQEDHRAGENISTQDDNTYSADDQRRTEAASKIQRWWRQQKKVPDNQKDNHLPSEFLNTDLRWNDAAVHARMKVCRGTSHIDLSVSTNARRSSNGLPQILVKILLGNVGDEPSSMQGD